MTCGVYEVWCGPYFYQGSSKNIELRWKQHRDDLSRGKHGNPKFQAAFNKYGWTDTGILVECEEHCVRAWEQDYIDANWGDEKFLNLHPVARGGRLPGRKDSPERRAALSAGQKRRFSDPNERARNREAQKIAQNREAVRAATAASVTALWQDPAYRERQVQAHKGHKPAPEQVAKMAESHRGSRRSDEAKANISAALKAYHVSRRAAKAERNEVLALFGMKD